ncbi:hypothetical protein GMA3_34 [Gordonia phage GMA3]|uniref:Uncharacterized protein n=1 Tax=Gordonia phage GMA3 TaxID=1647284 RepID=A0A0K0NKI7_9CAUD|nr:hypothetical protein AU105_gp034 [Gordonia phage GMA3]AKL88211.1 hypothetical protein GMA3_34 [Gordonia phage GMA3]
MTIDAIQNISIILAAFNFYLDRRRMDKLERMIENGRV